MTQPTSVRLLTEDTGVGLPKPEQYGTGVGAGNATTDTAAFVALMAANATSSTSHTPCFLTPGKVYNINTGALTWNQTKGYFAMFSVGGRRAATVNVIGSAGQAFFDASWTTTAGTNNPFYIWGIRFVCSGTFDAIVKATDVVGASFDNCIIEGEYPQKADFWVRDVNGWSERPTFRDNRELSRTSVNGGSGRNVYLDDTATTGSHSFKGVKVTNLELTAGTGTACKVDISSTASVYDSTLGPFLGNLGAGDRVLKITGNMRQTDVWRPQCESSADFAYNFELGTLSGGNRPNLLGKFGASGAHMAEWVTPPAAGVWVWEATTTYYVADTITADVALTTAATPAAVFSTGTLSPGAWKIDAFLCVNVTTASTAASIAADVSGGSATYTISGAGAAAGTQDVTPSNATVNTQTTTLRLHFVAIVTSSGTVTIRARASSAANLKASTPGTALAGASGYIATKLS